MKLQVLVSTMYQTDYSLIEKMNIQSDAVVVNQCDMDGQTEIKYKNYIIKWINTTERGVGRSRNRAILASSADILLFADDDVVYDDGASEKVLNYFRKKNKASLVTFNLTSLNPNRPETIVGADYRLFFWNCLKFGAFRIAVRRESILKENIFFSLLFGGGALYQAGEDNLFITKCIQSRLNCYACSEKIGTVAQKESTWFRGYNKKYYNDRGALFSAMYGKGAYLMLCLFEAKNPRKEFILRLSQEFTGVKDFRKY